MVMNFFRGASDGLEQVESEVAVMLASCRHSFDLAMSTLVTDADIAPLGDEIRSTDSKINAIEENVRRELLVHSAVQGGSDVGAVLSLLLVVKKLERVGDQAKNILNLAEAGVRFSGADDYDRFVAYRSRVSALFADAQTLLGQTDPDIAAFVDGGTSLMDECEAVVISFLHDEGPGSYAVPRAMLFRYLKRTVANILGTIVTTVDGVDRTSDDDDLDE
jgi:phosphate uptake regulator